MRFRGSSRGLLLVAFSAVALAGCGEAALHGNGPKRPKNKTAKATPNPFPTRDTLDKLARMPMQPQVTRNIAPAADWKVDASGADVAPPIEARFAQVATKAGAAITYSKELRCAARELGRFQLEHDASPDERLKRFIIAACGLTTPSIATGEQKGDAPKEITDETIVLQWQSKLTIPEEYRGGGVGIWMGRKGKRVVIFTTATRSQTDVVVSPSDTVGQIFVRGTAPAGSEMVLGLVNQGEHGVAHCEPDTTSPLPLPLFALRCPMAEGDKTAWVEVASRAQGHVLLRSFGLALARRDPTAIPQYAGPPREPRPVTTAPELRAAVLEGVNRARASGKLAPVTMAPTQTSTNERLAPHFFQAALTSDQQKGDVVGLGLLAGWDVQGTIRNGNLFAALLSGTKDASSWLDYALEMPMGRYTMLEPGARQIAIGVPPPGEVGGLGAVVTTYELFGGPDHRADAARVFDRMARLRTSRGLQQPVAIQGIKALGVQATLVNAGRTDAEDALNEVLLAERDRTHRSVRGWVVSTNDLDAVPFPPEMLAAGPLNVGVEVTHHRPEGAAWGSYVVFLVMQVTGAPQNGVQSPQIQAVGEQATQAF